MAVTAPLGMSQADFNRLLLQGEEEEVPTTSLTPSRPNPIDDSDLQEFLAARAAPTTTPIGTTPFDSAIGGPGIGGRLRQQAATAAGVGEAALSVGTGVAATTAGAAMIGAKALADIGSGPQKDYWRKLVGGATELATSLTYSPRTQAGQDVMGGVNTVLEPITTFSHYMADNSPFSKYFLNEDQRHAFRYAHELITFAALSTAGASALRGVRSKLASFRKDYVDALEVTTISGELPAPQQQKLLTAARTLTDAVQNDPKLSADLQAARQQFVDTLRARQEQLRQAAPATTADASGPGASPGTRVSTAETPTTTAGAVETTSLPREIASVEPAAPVAPAAISAMDTAMRAVTTAEAAVAAAKPGKSRAEARKALAEARTNLERVGQETAGLSGETLPTSEPVTIPIEAEASVTPAIKKPSKTTEKKVIADPNYQRPPLQDMSTMQDYVQQNLRNSLDLAERYGITDEIIQRAVSGRTANQIVSDLDARWPSGVPAADRRQIVRDVRTNYAIPNLDEVRAGEAMMPAIRRTEPMPAISTNEPAAPVQRPITYESASLTNMRNRIASPDPVGIEGPSGPISIRRTGTTPDAIMIDAGGMNTITPLEIIKRDVARGRITPDVAQAMENNLRRQADFAGVPLEQAHLYSGQRILSEAAQLAHELKLELYDARRTKAGLEYQQVPEEYLLAENKLTRASKLTEPPKLTLDEADAFIAQKTRDAGPATVEEIRTALENMEDISPRLPEDIKPHFEELLQQQRAGLDTTEARGVLDILLDLMDVIAPPDTPPTQLGSLAIFGLTPKRKAALTRLQADAHKLGVSLKDRLDRTNLTESDKLLFLRHAEQMARPLPQPKTTPQNMAMHPESVIAGDIIVHQRVTKDGTHPPVYLSDLEAFQNARPLAPIQGLSKIGSIDISAARMSVGRPGGSGYDVLQPYHALRRANLLDPVMYAYRASERAGLREQDALVRDLQAMAKLHDNASQERIGEYGYAQNPQGRNILAENGREVPTLNANERSTYIALRTMFDQFLERVNAVREAAGRPLVPRVDDYIPFMRMMSLAEKLDRPINMVHDTPEHIFHNLELYGNMQFPREISRTGATYRAEFNAFKLAEDYGKQITRQIHMGPFISVLDELIGHALPDIANGGNNWLLAQKNPTLYAFMRDWRNHLVHGVDPIAIKGLDNFVRGMMSNMSSALLGASINAGLKQPLATKLTWHATGMNNFLLGASDMMTDAFKHFTGSPDSKITKLLSDSQVLDTRGIQDVFTDATDALLGRNPREWYGALKRGEVQVLPENASRKLFSFMNAMDTLGAIHAGLAARRLGEHIGLTGDKLINFVDDVIVRTQGGTMPGDVAAIQRSTAGRAATQFQRFLISEWNYIIEDVFGAAGHKEVARLLNRDPNKFLPAVVKSTLMFAGLTALYNSFYEDVLGINNVGPAPVRTAIQEYGKGDNVLGAATSAAAEFIDPIPVIGSTRYGRGITGPVLDTIREASATARSAPLSYRLRKPDDSPGETAARIYGSPFAKLMGAPASGQVGRTVLGLDRGNTIWPSLTGFYQDAPQTRGIRGLRSSGEGIKKVK